MMSDIHLENELQLKWESTDISKKFKLHQCYEVTGSMRSPICKTCNKSDFSVACGSYFTVLMCMHCGKECCIHDG